MLRLKLIIFIVFFYLFSCIKINTDKYHINTFKEFKSFTNSIYLKVSFNISLFDTSDYLNIQIENNRKAKLGQISFYSKYDYDCMPDRDQMSINPYGDNFMAISKDQLIDYNNNDDYRNKKDDKYDVFYLCIYCLEEMCNYNVNFELKSFIDISYNNYYNYLVNENNQKFMFSFVSNKNNSKLINDFINAYELIWIKRMNNNKYINFNNILPEKYNGILFENTKYENEILNFTINSYIGDYITIGRTIIIGNTNYEPLRINDMETIGYLEKKSNFNEECFKIEKIEGESNVYIKGIFYDKFVGISYKELESENIISEIQIKEGNFIENLSENLKNGTKICVSLLNDSYNDYYPYDNITFIIQLFSNKIKNYNYYYNTFDSPGFFYTIDLKYDEIMVLSGIITNKNKISITVNSIYGFPKVYLDDCKKFPFCKYEDSFDLANLAEVNINTMNNYSFINKITKGDINIFDSFKPLLIIHCPFKNDCFFSTTFFTEEDYIILREDALFNQYLLEGEKNNFIINYENHKNIIQIILDLIIFNGNVQIKLNYKEKFFILNKIVYIIDSNSEELLKNNKKLKLTIIGLKNSFYTLKYKLIRKNVDNNNNIKMLYNRINNIEYLDVNKNYVLESVGPKISLNLINFYSPNCKFNISKNNQTLETSLFNNFYQEIFNGTDKYNFNIFFYKSYPIKNKDKKCILYSNKILAIDELNEISQPLENLLIIENAPQIFLFNNDIWSIIYKYPNIDNEKDLIVNIRFINPGIYSIYIYNNLKSKLYNEDIFTNQIIYLEKEQLKDIDSLKVEVNFLYKIFNMDLNNNKILDISVRQIKNIFFYLEKGKYKQDLIVGENNLFLYMDIEKEDEGYIMVDFYKLKG